MFYITLCNITCVMAKPANPSWGTFTLINTIEPLWNCFITTLHAMPTRSSNENSVCPSVKRVDCDKADYVTVVEVRPIISG